MIEFDADDDPDTQIQSALARLQGRRATTTPGTELRKLSKEQPERLDVQG